MSLAIGDKVRLKRTYRTVNPLPYQGFAVMSLPEWFFMPRNEYTVSELSSIGVRISIPTYHYGFWVTRDSVEKVEDEMKEGDLVRVLFGHYAGREGVVDGFNVNAPRTELRVNFGECSLYFPIESLQKVNDKPVNERLLRTMYVYGLDFGDVDGFVRVTNNNKDKFETFSVDSETAKTIRLGDEYEVIIRRK